MSSLNFRLESATKNRPKIEWRRVWTRIWRRRRELMYNTPCKRFINSNRKRCVRGDVPVLVQLVYVCILFRPSICPSLLFLDSISFFLCSLACLSLSLLRFSFWKTSPVLMHKRVPTFPFSLQINLICIWNSFHYDFMLCIKMFFRISISLQLCNE